jgi:hypothetical protein
MRTLALITALLICHSARAGTVQERLLTDRAFTLYVTTFKITQAPDGSTIDVQPADVVIDVRWRHEHPGQTRQEHLTLPTKRYIAAAVKKLRAKHWPLYKHSGKTEDFYTYLYYSPQLGSRVIEDVHEPE